MGKEEYPSSKLAIKKIKDYAPKKLGLVLKAFAVNPKHDNASEIHYETDSKSYFQCIRSIMKRFYETD